jgi:hypothetical protein
MQHFAPHQLEQRLVEQTMTLLSRIEAASGRIADVRDVAALMLLVDQVHDNVSALTGEVGHDCDRDNLGITEADYLLSRPLELSELSRVAIRDQVYKLAARMRAIVDGPQDEDVPF